MSTREICCSKYVPDCARFEGELFTCRDCGIVWEWKTDESEGSYWEDVDVITENSQQESAELAEESFDARNSKS